LESKPIIVINIIETKKKEYKMPEQKKMPSDSEKQIVDLEAENYELKKENLKLRKEIDKLRSKNQPLPKIRTY
jgi:predicted RNase H-like nuclease (RuvC/YqgF family)